jgi:glycerol uptake facilitator-like aquaporin
MFAVRLSRRLAAEALGAMLLTAIVVGSGIMAVNLSAGNNGLALLANALATAAGLYVLIVLFAPFSAAHFNPVVSLVAALQGQLPRADALRYSGAQVLGCVAGCALAHGMFDLPLFAVSDHHRLGFALLLSELVATFGLLTAILFTARSNPQHIPVVVACYIGAAYWFTASTSFANPAITLARALTNTFAGISPASVLPFIGAQVGGALLALLVYRWFIAGTSKQAS